MKKVLYAVSAGLLVLAPGALALADDGQQPQHAPLIRANIGTEVDADTDVHLDGAGDNEASGSVRWHGQMNASTSTYMRGEKEGLEKHFGTTTPPGIERHDDASSTPEHERGGISAFFNWLFGHSSSTTVADLKAEVASGSVSTTAQGSNGFFNAFVHIFTGWMHR